MRILKSILIVVVLGGFPVGAEIQAQQEPGTQQAQTDNTRIPGDLDGRVNEGFDWGWLGMLGLLGLMGLRNRERTDTRIQRHVDVT